MESRLLFCLPVCVKVDVTDPLKTAEALLKIASVYKEENSDVKNAVLDTIGEMIILLVDWVDTMRFMTDLWCAGVFEF